MIQLAEIFQDGMLIQRDMPYKVWGNSTDNGKVQISIDGKVIAEREIRKGNFSIMIPQHKAAENVTLAIGDSIIKNVDFGEVWIAGGQSNMEFYMKYDSCFDDAKEIEEDEHFRYFEVAKYCFEGEEKDGFKDGSNWNCWKKLTRESVGEFSAVATWFAMELRQKYHVPVAVVSCNWGGTSASAWIGREILEADSTLAVYLREYKEKIAEMDMELYYQKNYAMRQSMSTPLAKQSSDYMMKNTVSLEQVVQYSMKLAAEAGIDVKKLAAEDSGRATEDFAMMGPHDANRPCGLYENMLSKIAGFTARGVIWYQGESDVTHPEVYERLFALLIRQLRTDWERDIPIVYAQIAPFESWMQASGKYFPEIRKQQFAAWQHIENIHMVSSSDCGNRYDIHPKNKRPIGHRMALCARKHVYHEAVQGDAPVAKGFAYAQDGKIKIFFSNTEELTVRGDEIQAVRILSDGEECGITEWQTEGNALILTIDRQTAGKEFRIELAQMPYYQVNLYNEQGLPAFPFVLNSKK